MAAAPARKYIPLAERKNNAPGDDVVDEIMRGLSHVESQGDYDVRGPVSPKSGDRAYGKYQFMGEYIPGWTKQYLGREMSPEELLASPDAQEQLMRARVADLYSKYGNPDDVASVHFTGRPVAVAGLDEQDYTGTTNAEYLDKFHEGMAAAPKRKYVTLAERKGWSPMPGTDFEQKERSWLDEITGRSEIRRAEDNASSGHLGMINSN